jgi:hypothetical protein
MNMLLKSIFSKWTQVAGVLLMGAALAWAIKLSVIISTNGRIINTGAAALFMKIGLLLFLIGSTGIGNRLSRNSNLFLRTTAILLSPVAVFCSIFLLGMATGPLFRNSSVWYAPQEAPIAFAVVLYIAVGYFLYRSYKPAVR